MKRCSVLILMLLYCVLAASSAFAAAKADDGLKAIKGGSFRMGSPASEAWREQDETSHLVKVANFRLAPREVTQEEYQRVTGKNPARFRGAGRPVENVSWLDAAAYCNALSLREGFKPAYKIKGASVAWDRTADGYRLPTEAEWEYACRAGTDTPFNTKTSISAAECNYYGHYPYMIEGNYFDSSKLKTKPGVYRQETVNAGSFKPNGFGLYDMHGNVREWCWDWYGPYDASDADEPDGPADGTNRVLRGGGWNDFGKHLRSACRMSAPAGETAANIGFRLARGALKTTSAAASAAPAVKASGKKILVAYFSWSGNTRAIAQKVREQTGADLFEIQCVKPYSTDYDTVLMEAQRDQRAQARPAIRGQVREMARYGVILLGYPNWWASIPMPVATFLEQYDFAGKTIVPFSSNGGGGLGQGPAAIAKLAPRARLGRGLSVSYGGGSGLAGDIAAWLAANGVKKR